MSIKTLWGGLTPITKWIIIGSLLALIMIGAAVFILWQSSSFEDREREREAEREVLRQEKDALARERDAAKLEASEAKAKADALSVLVADKKANAEKVLAELKQAEEDYEKRKAEIEQSGGSMSDGELWLALCAELKRQGRKVTCPN